MKASRVWQLKKNAVRLRDHGVSRIIFTIVMVHCFAARLRCHLSLASPPLPLLRTGVACAEDEERRQYVRVLASRRKG